LQLVVYQTSRLKLFLFVEMSERPLFRPASNHLEQVVCLVDAGKLESGL
jgi:hypothetical protein